MLFRSLNIDYAASGAEALDKMRFVRFALVVLDWRLPLVSGAEVLRKMKAGQVRVPVVVLSGLHRQQIPEDLSALGASFLNKDEMDPITFHAAIAEALKLLGHKPVENARERPSPGGVPSAR